MVFFVQGAVTLAMSGLLASGLQASPVPTVPTTTTAVAPPAPVAEKKLCRRQQVSGSLFPRTTCHTKAEWVEVDAANLANAEQIRDRNKLLGAGQN